MGRGENTDSTSKKNVEIPLKINCERLFRTTVSCVIQNWSYGSKDKDLAVTFNRRLRQRANRRDTL